MGGLGKGGAEVINACEIHKMWMIFDFSLLLFCFYSVKNGGR